MQDFNGQGKPLDDKRLTLSGTTSAGHQQYRMWHDSETILIPKTQSITKPLQPEHAQANVGVFGSINEGYFQSPIAEFRNTHNYDLFDRFKFEVFKDEFDEDSDFEVMGITQLHLFVNLQVQHRNIVANEHHHLILNKSNYPNYTLITDEQPFTTKLYYLNVPDEHIDHVGDFFVLNEKFTPPENAIYLGNINNTYLLYYTPKLLQICYSHSILSYDAPANPFLPILFLATNIEIERGYL